MVKQWIGQKYFSAVHQRNLVYNTCWEDPRLDRAALNLGPDDTVLVITSAGCNALDYALQGPRAIHAVDVNPLQNSLLELKKAAIQTLDYGDFFQVFGRGQHPRWKSLYADGVRPALAPHVRRVWDDRQGFFDGSSRRKSFYYRGTSGMFAWMINGYLNRPRGLRDAVREMLAADTVDQQAEIYRRRRVSELLFTGPIRWVLRRDTTMSLLGVPRSQRMQIERGYPRGIAGFVQDRIEAVFNQIPLKDNYFWRVYLTGQYSPNCCPEYLTRDGFNALQAGLANRIQTATATVEDFLNRHDGAVSRFVLLDHMDWLYENMPERLAAEWQSIVNRSAPQTRILWRSAALDVDFVDPLRVTAAGELIPVGDLLRYQRTLAGKLHRSDRVHTYGSFYIADLQGGAA
ncbi:DUF3419 family protein [Roseiconus nitratireducens]|uniref:DUF3419 family protein n=1 Tax=Roseiconus nitratireducens TaxID=2605748 RepID=A0A5M6DG86_9BACT|nr:BtaA family protein [Roseiconus nitratireducens]KAA5545302.1 DUF3419 family protein [Roseiconus nitratireducens]